MDNYKIGDEVELLEDFYTRSGAEIIFKKGTIAKVIELQLYDEIHIDVNGDNRWCSPDILKLVDKKDPALISGADALRALADGVKPGEIEGKYSTGLETYFLPMDCKVDVFLKYLNEKLFRLKPQTIKLELELPMPFKPRDGDDCFIVDSEQEDGFYRFTYSEDSGFHQNFIQFGVYKTEDDVRKVVEQLRKIRGAS